MGWADQEIDFPWPIHLCTNLPSSTYLAVQLKCAGASSCRNHIPWTVSCGMSSSRSVSRFWRKFTYILPDNLCNCGRNTVRKDCHLLFLPIHLHWTSVHLLIDGWLKNLFWKLTIPSLVRAASSINNTSDTKRWSEMSICSKMVKKQSFYYPLKS